GTESAMRTGCLGLLVLLTAGALGPDVRAQSAMSVPGGSKEGTLSVRAAEHIAMPSVAPAPPRGYPPWPGGDWPRMAQGDGTGTASTPSGQQGTADASAGQMQQSQQPQPEDPRARQEADRAALRRDHYGPREGMWFGAGPLVWWMKNAPSQVPLVT